ncbi:MAG: four helix bundle protein [Candidatus Omnitrophota bacterium]|nr:four helix bundle protein [Candidatus Omnitrophota bacterium]
MAENKKLRTYKDLIAWQKAYELCVKVFRVANAFPAKEQLCLASQIKRSSLSVPSNIAEGYTRHQTKEYLRFLYIAYASLAELETQLLLANDLKYILQDDFRQIVQLHGETQRIIHGLLKSLKRIPAYA